MTEDPSLPVIPVLPSVLDALRQSGNVVLKAPTGAGKTTHVPPAILAAELAERGLILMLEPRRLAAQAAARRMAALRGEPIGKTVGYQIRFDRQASSKTRVLVVTEGIFLRMLLDDPLLEQVAVVVFDEFHERSLASDLSLALTRRIQTGFRPELKLAVMSATFDPERIASYLQCPVVSCEGRLHPIEIKYLRFPSRDPLPAQAAAAVASLLSETPGDVLVFLPGVGEIRQTRSELQSLADEHDFDLLELYGDLPAEKQEAVLQPQSRRKVILATNVAETSVTIPGVTAVVDSGFARIMRCQPGVGLNRLEKMRISRASADQRAGRAGRTQPGVCLRLWSVEEMRMFREYDEPEVARLDLAGAVLQLHAWGETDPRTFPWFQPPPPNAIDQAESLLRRLGALDDRGLTELGQFMARIPVHPRLARLLIEGQRHDCLELAATAAALLSERDPFRGNESRQSARRSTSSDVLDRVQALHAYREARSLSSDVGVLSALAADHVLRVREHLLRETRGIGRRSRESRSMATGMRNMGDVDEVARTETGGLRHPARRPARRPERPTSDDQFLQSLLAGYPDRVARRREANGRSGVLVGGRGVRLADTCAVRDGTLFLCVDIEETGGQEALVRQASHVDPRWLDPRLLTTNVEVEFDENRERVVAFRRTRYDGLLLDESATDTPDGEAVAARLASAAGLPGNLERALPLDDESVAQFRNRVEFLRQFMPELQLPEAGEDQLRSLLPDLCRGCRSFTDLHRAPLLDYLRGQLTAVQLAALEREAPVSIAAASGSRIRLQYAPGRPPVMAVRIQEMFGQLETPRVAGGRIPVLLHLLAPNMRPQQVTDDLAGFWERAYPVIRKELRQRYPKHAWPDRPAEANPERRPKRK